MGVKGAIKAAGAEETEQVESNMCEAIKTENKGKYDVREAEETLTLVYIGPSLPSGKLKTNKIMIGTMGEIKKELEDILEKFPLVEKMLVPVDKLAEKKDKARTAGNILNKYYSDIASSVNASTVKGE